MSSGLPISKPLLPTGYFTLGNRQSPVVPARAASETATFIDPTTVIDHARQVGVKAGSYLAPFTLLVTGRNSILVGEGSDLQDNVTIDARAGSVVVGDNDPLAHDVTVIGPSHIGATGGLPTFVSFNAVIDRATLEPDTYVSPMARIGPGVVLHSGMKVMVGKFVQTQAEADDPALGKVEKLTDDDRDFVNGVLHVNHELASGYAGLYHQSPTLVLGIGANPDIPDFNPGETIPTTGGKSKAVPSFRNRIIGKATLIDHVCVLNRVLGLADSIRADEGYPFTMGKIKQILNRTTFHALEHSGITTGNGLRVGYHTLIHGGPDVPNADPKDVTVIGNNVSVGSFAVLFQSTVGNNVRIGNKTYVANCNLASGTVVPNGTIMVNNVVTGMIEW